jgi:hypothetical protein
MTSLLKLVLTLLLIVAHIVGLGLMVGFFLGAVFAGFKIFPW